MYESWTEIDRRTLVFIRSYEQQRKAAGQFGYKAFKGIDVAMVETPLFKQFRTVVRWLDEQGWQVTWAEVHWQGYVKYVFAKLSSCPQPGQLKNPVLLKHYIKQNAAPEHIRARTATELEELYSRVLRKEISSSPTVMAAIGLRGIQLGDPATPGC